MVGRVGLPLRLDLPPSATPSAPTLRPGDTLTIRVLASLGGGRYTVVVRGVRLEARSKAPLPVGGTVQAEVGPRGGITLKLTAPALTAAKRGFVAADTGTAGHAAPPSQSSVLINRTAGGPIRARELDALSQRVVEALARSGMPPTPQLIAAMRAMIPAEREHDAQFLRFVSLLVDKHLFIGRSGAESLFRSLEGVNPDTRGHGGGSGANNGAGSGEGGSPADHEQAGADGTGGDAIGGQDTGGRNRPQDGRRQLREQLEARNSGALSPLALFNHARGQHATWIAVPFRLDHGELCLQGSIRMLVNPRNGALSVLKLVIVVDEGGEERSAYLIEGSPPARLRVLCSDSALRRSLEGRLPLLSEKLRNLGIKTDDTISGDIGFDGFTTDRQETKGIDTIA